VINGESEDGDEVM